MSYFMSLANSKTEIIFPVAPSKLTLKIENNNKTINLINEGDVNLIKTPGLTEITIDELLLPSFQHYPFAYYKDKKFLNAQYFLGKLEEFKKGTSPLTFRMVRTTPSAEYEKFLFDTVLSVTLEDYEIVEDAENTFDVVVSLNLKEYRTFSTKKIVIKTAKKATKTTTKKKTKTKKTVKKKKKTTKKAKAKTYTVKKGDTLPKIAKKKLGKASYKTKIYNLNKSVIEKAAKKHGRKSSSKGWFIYIGTKLKLPTIKK